RRARVTRGPIRRGGGLLREVRRPAAHAGRDRAGRSGMARRAAEAAPSSRGMTLAFTFDTGMLIALERRKPRAMEAFRAIVHRGLLPVVPAVVYAEWWRGRSDVREAILAAVTVEGMPASLCR